MEQLKFFNQHILGYIKYGKGLAITEGGIKYKKENILTIDSLSPSADLIVNPVEVNLYENYDFILFPNGLKGFKSVLSLLRKVKNFIGVGGRIIFYCEKDILVNVEFEGLMYLFYDTLAVEQRIVKDAETYIYITRRIK